MPHPDFGVPHARKTESLPKNLVAKKEKPLKIRVQFFFELAVLEAGLASNFLQATGVSEVRPGRRKERKSKKEGVEYTGNKEKIIDRKGG